ncbi:MAG: NAD(+)/NADH kinase [Elusimicrobia bacterium]|nr:NAD(+)/NADH kinase [Elusimicrobiota bacterium]
MVIFHNPEKLEARREVPKVKAWFRKKGVRILVPAQAAKASFAVALGGDGTLLKAARKLAPLKVPVLGINLGRLGFLASTDYSRAYQTLDDLLREQLSLSKRMMLWVKPPRGGGQLALNDCIVRVSTTARVIRLSASVNGHYLGTYVGDGVILSTPTGSTAYSLAASGPIVEPETDMILLTPICSHSLTQRPIILSSGSVVEVRVEERRRGDKVVLSLDGQMSFRLHVGDSVKIRRAPEAFYIYNDKESPYFSLLRQKLKWGE